MRPIDDDVTSRAVRSEDAFDVPAVHFWLRERAPVPDDLPRVTQFTSGASNLTFLLNYAGGPELVLRKPPAGHKAASAHDMAREHRVQQALRPVFSRVPQMIGLCEDPAVIGSTFYVMERVEGFILRNVPRDLEISQQQASRLGERFVDTLAALHGVDVEASGLGDLGRGPGYVRRQVDGWTQRYAAARTDNVPDFSAVTAWLDRNAPVDVAERLIHNDFRLDNLVLDDRFEVRAVLDWEMATVGDPLMDLGGALAYWVQADDDDIYKISKRQPSDLAGMPTRSEIVAAYAARSGLAVDDWPFYEVYGLFRLAGIAQQIYFRFHHGQTTNPAFKDFWFFVTYLEQRCKTVAGLP